MDSRGGRILCLALIVACLTDVTIGQLADNLMVSGSDRPMAYGVGTYGLAGAGTQGISGSPNGGGLYSQKIPTVTISKRVPGVIVSDGAGHAQVFQNNFDAFRDLTSILGNGISQQVESHLQQQFGGPQIGTQSFAVAQSPRAAAPNGGAMYGDDLPPSGPMMQAGRRLHQATILENLGTQALSAIQNGAVAETSSLKADVARALQPGDLPTITSTQDGTVQLLTNNNSGDEMQLRKDGTFTFVNGGDSPGIFSVGPKGVHFEKDNIFKSRMYMARAPSGDSSNGITISNDNGSQYASASGATSAGAAGSATGGVQTGNPYTSGSDATTTMSGQGMSAQAPTASTDAQNAYLNAAPAPAPLQDSTAFIGNTQAAGSSQLDQQQNSNPSAAAAYSAQYASAPQAADSAYSGAAVAPAPVLDSAYSGTGVVPAPVLDSTYSGAAVAPAPVLEAQYGSSQAFQPQSTSSFGSGKWQMADASSSVQAPVALSGSSTYTSNSGAPASSVEAYGQNSAPVDQSSFGTGSLIAQGPTAYPTAAQGPSAQTAATSAFAATVPVVQGLQASPVTNKSARQLPTAADVFNIGEGIASLLGRRLMSQRQ
ncbi:hypothetical protein COCOBI_07-1610 [Coccomyxa sp. Obi]|nr:hypothetical protein COCOBI_07-1610 [Coccomyxa sp. Obi]